jgi:hypothetical protein
MVQAPPRGAHAQPLWGIYKVSPVGAVAQLGERLICTQEVAGSIPVSSTISVVGCLRLSGRNGLGPVAQLARAHP